METAGRHYPGRMATDARIRPRSLVRATDIDVLPLDHVVARRDGYLMVRSPSNPTHYWGNLLIFDAPPATGDRVRWEECFAAEFADQPRSVHRTFAWDLAPGGLGAAREEFVTHGYDLDQTVGLVATPDQVRPHPRANREVRVYAADPRAGSDEAVWDGVVDLQVATRDADRFSAATHRAFCESRLDDLRALFRIGHGSWYVALAGEEVVGSCGVVVTDGRGRFQAVDTAPGHRRRGICSRLVVEAAHHAAEHRGARQLVIGADPDYHALGIYESLGFVAVETVAGVCLAPGEG
jgi:ribosomal protein S18 acetylase RimI-like enzyme